MDRDKELIQIKMFDEDGNTKEVILRAEEYPDFELRGDAIGQFEQAIADIAVSSIDLTVNPRSIPHGAHS